MMRRLAGSLLLLGACLAACAAAAASAAKPLDRSWAVTVSPDPGDVSLLQIGFPRAGAARVSAATLDVAAPPAFGSDYLAVAAVRPGLGGARALVLVANRASALEDPSRPALAIRARRALGPPVVLAAQNLLATRPSAAPRPSLCDLALGGAPLGAASLRILDGAGQSLSGLGGAQALAEAYDLACGLPNSGTLRAALALPVGGGGCEPCDPAPGYACPLAQAVTALCIGPVSSGLRG